MRIAYYAPLKSPDHPVPSGDRVMAGMLRAALAEPGHEVLLVSELRSYCGDPDNHAAAADIASNAKAERQRIALAWRQAIPQVWVCYHPYFKSPDLIGPPLCRAFGVPYVTIESSYSTRRNMGVWAASQAAVLDGLAQAAVNICLTARDRAGIVAQLPNARVVDLPPFIDPAPHPGPHARQPGPVRLITVAMMRAGDKFSSYTLLAQALQGLGALDWKLTIVGAGAMEPKVRALFSSMQDRVIWAGLCDPARVADLLAHSDVYVWPGFGEAYGLAYLEAQAAGLAVVAQQVAGVPEVVTSDTGLLTQAGDVAGYRAALRTLITDHGLRRQLGQAARRRVLERHSFQAASARLAKILGEIGKAAA